MDRLLTPSKVTAWLDCEHFLTLTQRVEEGLLAEPNTAFGSFARLLVDKGLQHEADCLAEYTRQGKTILRIPAKDPGETFTQWLERIENPFTGDWDVIYQMPLAHGGVQGVADFLLRTVDSDTGEVSYEPVDAKLAIMGARVGTLSQTHPRARDPATAKAQNPQQPNRRASMATLAIDRRFLSDLVKLEKRVAKRVTEVFDEFNNATHGLHLEPINNARNPRYRSIRIDQFWRGIVLAPESGDVYTLLKVLPHDDAYRWAERRSISVNSATDGIEIRDEAAIEESLPELDQAPPGWYPVPQGGQRYWDGQRWLDLPDPNSRTANLTGRSGVRVIAIASALVVLMSIAIGAAVWKNDRDTRMLNAAGAASSSKAAADAEADRVRRDTDAKHAHRADLVKQVEEAIKHSADTQGREGLFDGPVLDVSCDPVSGGSINDLSAESTIFECFAATKDNGDGTRSGMKYHAAVNWDTEHYTYGLGAPR